MAAIAYIDAYPDVTPAAPRVQRAPKRSEHRPYGDPLIDATTRLLSVPLHQLYAVLWRAGVLLVDS